MLVLDSIKKRRHMMGGTVLLFGADQWKFAGLPNLLKKFYADIYNADEIGLFYCAMLDASLSCRCAARIWFRESSGMCNCVVLFRHVRN
jgi:hypothetical protein